MRLTMWVLSTLLTLPLPVPAQSRDDARQRDLLRLQDEVENLDEELRALEADDPKTEGFRRRADEVREDLTYLKVKMRRHQRSGGEGTGVSYDEVAEVRRAVVDLHEDIDRAFRGAATERRGEVRIAEGTQILVRLEQSLSSKTARREDRFEASIYKPVRAEGVRVLPAGTRVRGVVRDSEPAQRPSKGGRLDLAFDAVYLDRTRMEMSGRVAAVEEDERSEKAGIGAVLGGVLGGILGGKRGALVGVLIGGTGAVVGSKGNDVELPTGTILTVRLDRALIVPRR